MIWGGSNCRILGGNRDKGGANFPFRVGYMQIVSQDFGTIRYLLLLQDNPKMQDLQTQSSMLLI